MELWSDVEGMIGKNDMRAVWCGGIGFFVGWYVCFGVVVWFDRGARSNDEVDM